MLLFTLFRRYTTLFCLRQLRWPLQEVTSLAAIFTIFSPAPLPPLRRYAIRYYYATHMIPFSSHCSRHAAHCLPLYARLHAFSLLPLLLLLHIHHIPLRQHAAATCLLRLPHQYATIFTMVNARRDMVDISPLHTMPPRHTCFSSH